MAMVNVPLKQIYSFLYRRAYFFEILSSRKFNTQMKLSCMLAFLFAVAMPLGVHATGDDDGYDNATIRASDIPTDAPLFSDYPAEAFTGSNAKLKVGNDLEVRRYRTRLREWSARKVNFAGHYILTIWGCGTGCVQIMFIDAKSGKVFHPAGIRSNVAVNVHDEMLEGGRSWYEEGSVHFQLNSELLVLVGAPEEDIARRGISYYVWHSEKLKLVRHVAKLEH
jgi:hypothetical protein